MKKQRDIMNEQKNISVEQKQLIHTIDQSSKALTLRAKYADLSNTRKSFWFVLKNHEYPQFNASLKNELTSATPSELIDNSHFPSDFEPGPNLNLRRFIEDHEQNWREVPIWLLAQHIHKPGRDESIGSTWQEFYKLQHDLAYFWDDSFLLLTDILDYLTPDPHELLILTWLEFALVLKTNDRSGRAGKAHLFRLAQDEWTRYEQSKTINGKTG